MLADALDHVANIHAVRGRPSRQSLDLLAEPGFVLAEIYEQAGRHGQVCNANDEPVQFELRRPQRTAHRHTHHGIGAGDDDGRAEGAPPSPPDGAAEQREDEIHKEGAGGTERQVLKDRKHHDIRRVSHEREAVAEGTAPRERGDDQRIDDVPQMQRI